MDRARAKELIKETFESHFDKEKYVKFIKNLLNKIEEKPFTYQGNYIPDAFKAYISRLERIGKYTDGENEIDLLIVNLKKGSSLERARTTQRNFIAWYLKGSRGGKLKDAALVAFVSPGGEDWRFSLVKIDYSFVKSESGKVKVKEEFTSARRWSFLVGKNERSHTAQSRLVPILEEDEHNPTLAQLEEAFNVEPVTKEFFEKYRELLIRTVDALDKMVEEDKKIKKDFESKGINTVDFSKKLLGQIVFLYFLQKKGWFGVAQDKKWGEGDKNFIRNLFVRSKKEGKNFFNDYLELLFYDTLNNPRINQVDPTWSKYFNCKIPFLNGGLFEPIGNYDWERTRILLPDDLFSNNRRTPEGDIGDGILDVFDRFNFTVKEDEPLEKEVAIDPELLGKLYEKFNAIRRDNFYEYKKALASGKRSLEKQFNKKFGVYYTPREIVHYMCQQSLIYYLSAELEGKVSKEDIGKLIKFGEQFTENETVVEERGKETRTYKYRLPESIRKNARLIDDKLRDIKICDPAIGSGAFLVGMMHEIVKTRMALNPFIKENNRNVYNFKRECIENSLYGVDIDAGACEVAKLRLWLSLVVDEEDIRKIKPLPNLDYKIVQGNSLLGVEKDLFNNALFNQLEKLKPLYFSETNPTRKQEYKKQIEELIGEITKGRKEFDYEVYFSEVFHEKGGFDVVIANPPYVDSETMTRTDKSSRAIYSSLYKSAKGNWDLFIIFIEKGTQLLKTKGIITYIVPNKLIAAKYAETLRHVLKANIREIRDFSKVNVFKEVDVYPIIFIAQNKVDKNPIIMASMSSVNIIANKNSIPAHIFCQDTDWARYFSPREVLYLILKISELPSLREYYGKVYSAATVSEAYEIKKRIKEHDSRIKVPFKKIVNTGTIDRYLILWGKQKMHYIKSSYLKPIILDKDLIFINERRYKQASSEKIIIAGMTKKLECVYDRGEFLAGKSTTIILSDYRSNLSLKVILSLLNSTLVSFWFRYFFRSLSLAGGYIRISHREISQIPVPRISKSQSVVLSNLVDKILSLTQSKNYLENPQQQARVKEYESQIDQIVYKLYGLTDEEIKIVEERSKNEKLIWGGYKR